MQGNHGRVLHGWSRRPVVHVAFQGDWSPQFPHKSNHWWFGNELWKASPLFPKSSMVSGACARFLSKSTSGSSCAVISAAEISYCPATSAVPNIEAQSRSMPSAIKRRFQHDKRENCTTEAERLQESKQIIQLRGSEPQDGQDGGGKRKNDLVSHGLPSSNE